MVNRKTTFYYGRMDRSLYQKLHAKVKRCPACGQLNSPNAEVCWNCGAMMK